MEEFIQRFLAELKKGDRAEISNTGGIDLTPTNMNLHTQNSGDQIKSHLDLAMLKQLQNAPGFVPVDEKSQ
jgi:hypothetical protein